MAAKKMVGQRSMRRSKPKTAEPYDAAGPQPARARANTAALGRSRGHSWLRAGMVPNKTYEHVARDLIRHVKDDATNRSLRARMARCHERVRGHLLQLSLIHI